MIPAGAIDSIDHQNRRINVRLTKGEIKGAPDYDAERRNELGVQKEHENYYGERASAGR
jgi:hypothetical protein